MNHSNREFADSKDVLHHLKRLKKIEFINACVLGLLLYATAIGIFLSGNVYAEYAQANGIQLLPASSSTTAGIAMAATGILAALSCVSAYLFYSLLKRRRAIENHIRPRITAYFEEYQPERVDISEATAAADLKAREKTINREFVSYNIWSVKNKTGEADSAYTATIRTRWEGFHFTHIESYTNVYADSAADLNKRIQARIDQLDSLIKRSIASSSSDVYLLRTPANQFLQSTFSSYMPKLRRHPHQNQRNG
ncbi:hypothetical protein [Alkalicoccus chagannorensis]|uniref:hypothetical protein n=1 Tax=Alkalicoccus chagannorensis TaxID=427072 RepID=UPI00041B58EA|nr:hypothetical protein [Alkalicoccus chagannorensis]